MDYSVAEVPLNEGQRLVFFVFIYSLFDHLARWFV